LPEVPIRSVVRTGDTPQSERARMRRTAPHIVVTTPESLYILLGSESGRAMLSTCRTVIVDEIHAIAGNKRGAHLALVARAAAGAHPETQIGAIGLSATQKPIEEVARLSDRRARATAIDGRAPSSMPATTRRRDLALELPAAMPLEAVMSGEVWTQVYDRLAELVREHRTTSGVREYAAARRTGRAPSCRSASARRMWSRRITAVSRRRAPRCGTAAEAGRAKGPGGDGLLGARHRHRRR
jgi:ATP-dependent Lhr-like helicase